MTSALVAELSVNVVLIWLFLEISYLTTLSVG